MKRCKDEEKIMGPMFPRLHVNDTEKGGPRAPPRNKMALYEQLSVPSQRFNHGVLPRNPTNTTANSLPSASSSQLAGNERGMSSWLQLPPRRRHLGEKPYGQYSDLSTPTLQVEQIKKSDEDDCRVPILINTRPSHDRGKYVNGMDMEKFSPSFPTKSYHSTNFHKTKQASINGNSARRGGKSQKEVNREEFVAGRDQLVKAISDNSEGLRKQTDTSQHYEPRANPANSIDRLKAGHSVQSLLCAESQNATNTHIPGALREHSMAVNRKTSKRDLPSEEHNMVRIVSNKIYSREDRSCRSLQMGNMDRADSVSGISMVASKSELDISPDDVVGVIGQKHFWRARRAIFDQQRVFAVQVFELHRLIKVQRLIAGSPELLLEDAAAFGKPVKASPTKKLMFDHIVKAHPVVPNHKGDFEKPNQTVECSTENTVEKVSLSSVQNGVPPSSCRPVTENPLAPPISSNHNVGPWWYSQPPGQQWLIPVMSPSEGLVYKPYPGPEFMDTVCGGCGPLGSTLGYGVPAPHHQYQLPSFPPAGPHDYFPPYGMPMMNSAFSGSSVEQRNHLATPGKSSTGEANFSVKHQMSFNRPSQKIKVAPDILRLQTFKDGELQASIASSPSERLQDSEVGSYKERRNALPRSSMSHAIDTPDSSPQPPEPKLPSQAIKVVPHNARSATESAARIFQFIQEERRRNE